MRWRKKKSANIKGDEHSSAGCRVHSHRPTNRIAVVLSLFAVITIYSLIAGNIASADVADNLKNEVNAFKGAMKIKACKHTVTKHNSDSIYLDNGSLNGMGNPLLKPGGPTSAWGGHVAIDIPYDEGIRDPNDSRGRIQCDIIWLAEQNGHSDFFAKYLLDNAKLNDGKDLSSSNQVVLMSTDIDSTANKVKERLNANDIRKLIAHRSIILQAIDAYPVPKLSDAAKAQLYKDIIDKYCSKGGSFVESGDGQYRYVTKGDDGKYVVKRGDFDLGYMAKQGVSTWAGAWHVSDGIAGNPDITCTEAVQKYSALADAYAEALNKEAQENPNKNNTDATAPEENKDECAAELNGFGSIICSGQNLFVTITQILFDTVSKILESQAELTKEDAVRKQWGNLLNVANAILIIAFLVVIYSTATSTGGLSNYDVKKLLPKIIIFAMAINLSYYICMALVDLSNILGHGIFGLFLGGKTGDAPQLMKTAKATADAISIPPEVGAITTVAIVAILIFLVGPPIIIALLTILFALVVRGMALMILVIISPVAIASYLFNSQGLSKGFTMWRDNYIKLLLVYPLFMLVWAGSRVVSSLNPNSPDATLAIFGLLMEVICLVAPAMSILPLFKMSGDIMGKATIAAHSNQAANKFAGWAGSKFTGKPGDPNSPGLRGKAAGVIGAAAGAAAGRAAGAVQNMRGVGASTGNIATQLDSQAMNSARNKVNKYGDRDLKTAFTTGQIGGKTLDPYQMRAVIEKELPNASAAEIKQSMQAVNTEADKLRRNGQAADADRLVQTFANTASANGNSIMSGKSLRNFATSGGWNTSQFEANYADAVADYSSTQLTAKDAAGMDAADLIQMRTTLQNAGANGGNIAQADAGLSSMAKQSNIALSDPKLTRKMNAPTVTALKDNTMVRSTAGERLANTHKIPNIYHDYNAGGTTSAQAISDARTMMAHTDFGRLDAIDQSRLRAIARASAPAGTGAPAAPVVIASWDSRVP